jgi:glucokinase
LKVEERKKKRKKKKMRTVVSGDIGGTNTRFVLSKLNETDPFSTESTIIYAKKYRNEDFLSFSDCLKAFLYNDAKIGIDLPLSACFAVAGPVADNKVELTNRSSWVLDGQKLACEFNIPVVQLINDFLAVGYGLLTLKEDTECVCLQKVEKKVTSPIACIGAGTGLGECFLTPSSDGVYTCFSSEGGHAEFAPRNEVSVASNWFSVS